VTLPAQEIALGLPVRRSWPAANCVSAGTDAGSGAGWPNPYPIAGEPRRIMRRHAGSTRRAVSRSATAAIRRAGHAAQLSAEPEGRFCPGGRL